MAWFNWKREKNQQATQSPRYQIKQLSEAEYKATFEARMHDVTESVTNVLDIGPYIELLRSTDLEGHLLEDRLIKAVYRSNDGHYDHVLLITKTANLYLVIVVDLIQDSIYDHHLLDLNREYGLQ